MRTPRQGSLWGLNPSCLLAASLVSKEYSRSQMAGTWKAGSELIAVVGSDEDMGATRGQSPVYWEGRGPLLWTYSDQDWNQDDDEIPEFIRIRGKSHEQIKREFS